MSIALWCVLVAGLLPIVTTGIAKATGSGGDMRRFDNANPRDWLAKLDGRAKRAHAAHLNGFEAFPLFAVAVIVAEMKGGAPGLVNMLAITFVAARLAFVWAYLEDKATIRSVVWAIGFFSAIAIFLTPVFR